MKKVAKVLALLGLIGFFLAAIIEGYRQSGPADDDDDYVSDSDIEREENTVSRKSTYDYYNEYHNQLGRKTMGDPTEAPAKSDNNGNDTDWYETQPSTTYHSNDDDDFDADDYDIDGYYDDNRDDYDDEDDARDAFEDDEDAWDDY